MTKHKQTDAEMFRIWGQIVARTWVDKEFKKKLLKNPKEVFREKGIHCPPGVNYSILENTETTVYLSLPLPPADMSEDDLKGISAAGDAGAYCW